MNLYVVVWLGAMAVQSQGQYDPLWFEVQIDPWQTEVRKDLGSSMGLSCSAMTQATETPTLRWEFNDVPITETDRDARLRVEDFGDWITLRLTNIEDNDEGQYTCVASLGGKEDRRSVRVTLWRLMIHSKTDQFGILGQDGTVECDVTAKPAPSITWKMANGTMIKSNDKYQVTKKGLKVTNLQFADDGVYICDVIVRKTGEFKALKINYVVVQLPVITEVPNFVPAQPQEGDEVKFHCKATGVPAPTYDFQKDGNTITQEKIDKTAGILTIADIKREDEAKYKCIASNVGGYDENGNTLNVLIPPRIDPIPAVEEAIELGKQEIVCRAEGDPAPEVSWRKKGMNIEYTETQDHPKIVVDKQGNDDAEIKVVTSKLIFDPVKAQDAGIYVCTAKSIGMDDGVQEVKMDVQYAPHFEVDFQQDVFYGWRGHRANLTCQASANGLASITWKRKNLANPEMVERVRGDIDFTLTDTRTDKENHLSSRDLLVFFRSDDGTLYGEYICEAVNVRGTATKTVTLFQATTPSSPAVSIASITSTAVTLGISKPEGDGGLKVTYLSYTYWEPGQVEQAVTETVDIAGDQTMVQLKGLKPSTTYVGNVTAINAVGEGQSEGFLVATKKASTPVKLTLLSKQIGSESSSYNLKWEEPNDGGFPITKIVIRYKQVKVSGDSPDQWTITEDVDKEFKQQTVTGSKATSFELKGLKEDAYYEVRIIAYNSQGASPVEVTVIKTIKGKLDIEATLRELVDEMLKLRQLLSFNVITLRQRNSALERKFRRKTTKVSREVDRLKRETKTLSGTSHNQTIALSDLEERASYMTAFSAASKQEIRPSGPGAVIVFDDIIYRHGNGYNSSSGIFTAPRAGVYVFHLVLMSGSNCCPGNAYIKANDEIINTVRVVRNQSQDAGQVSTSVVIALKVGDKVKVHAKLAFFWAANKHSVFTGYIIQAH